MWYQSANWLKLIKKLDEQDLQSAPQKLTIVERQQLLMQLLWQKGGLDQLNWWPPELAWKFQWLMMDYHDIFSLDKNEIRCMDAAEHVIELIDEEPFKEWFWQIAPPLLDKVWEHLQEMWMGELCSLCNPHGVMLWFWWRSRIPILYPRCRRLWNPCLVPRSSPLWT